MRRRAVVLGVPLGLVALAGCGPEGRQAPAAPAAPSAAPAVPAVPVEHPEPVLVGERADVVSYTEVNLPLEMTPMIVVDPGWTSAPFELDGVFLAHRVQGDHLRYVAVHQDGTVLWRADRPATCTDMVLTRGADGQPIAVLSDLDPAAEAGTDARTLTGYHLLTAEKIWGPLPSPGPQAALGLVRAADDRARTALSGATGLPLLAEADLAGGRILGEHLGTVLRTKGAGEGGELVAVGPDGQERWRAPLPDGVPAESAEILGAVDPSTSFAAIGGAGQGDAAEAGAVLDLADGRTIAEDARAVARDHVLEVTVVASGTVVRGVDDAGTEQWRHEDLERLVLLSAGERLAYAVRVQEGTLVVLDTGQGQMVQPYDADRSGPLAMPEVFSADTAAAVRVEERRLLVTTEFDPHYGRR